MKNILEETEYNTCCVESYCITVLYCTVSYCSASYKVMSYYIIQYNIISYIDLDDRKIRLKAYIL